MKGYQGEIPDSYINSEKGENNTVSSFIETDDFIWDTKKYKTRQEAIVIESAIEHGNPVKKDSNGKWLINKKYS